MFCPQCAKELPNGSTLCPFCGARLADLTNQGAYQTMRGPYPGYSFNSDFTLFQNPHTGLLAFLVIFGFLTAIFCNCGLFQYHETVNYILDDSDWIQYFPMWLLAAGGLYALFSGGSDSLFQQTIADSSHIDWSYLLVVGVLVVMAVMALCIFIFSCIVGGKSSLRHRHPSSQLRSMNVFLILSWIFWLVYTFLILLPMTLIYRETGEVVFLLRYTVWGYLYTACLVVVTILRFSYGTKVLRAYANYEQQSKTSRYMPYL